MAMAELMSQRWTQLVCIYGCFKHLSLKLFYHLYPFVTRCAGATKKWRAISRVNQSKLCNLTYFGQLQRDGRATGAYSKGNINFLVDSISLRNSPSASKQQHIGGEVNDQTVECVSSSKPSTIHSKSQCEI